MLSYHNYYILYRPVFIKLFVAFVRKKKKKEKIYYSGQLWATTNLARLDHVKHVKQVK